MPQVGQNRLNDLLLWIERQEAEREEKGERERRRALASPTPITSPPSHLLIPKRGLNSLLNTSSNTALVLIMVQMLDLVRMPSPENKNTLVSVQAKV